MNRLVIDAGNSRFKLAVFAGDEIVYRETVAEPELRQLQEIIHNWNPGSTILSSVVHLDTELVNVISLLPNSLFLDEKTELPIINNYATPETLGRDRLANAVGAAQLFPNAEVLVIDAGTCLKLDFVNKGAYIGGSISPGLLMRYKALNKFTDRLPHLEPVEEADLTGTTTSSSMHSGVINGMIAEINGMIQRYEEQHRHLKLILTGGDARYFLNHLKKSIFASPELTLKGLHSILVHNYPQ